MIAKEMTIIILNKKRYMSLIRGVSEELTIQLFPKKKTQIPLMDLSIWEVV
jgi:hypothetical protein